MIADRKVGGLENEKLPLTLVIVVTLTSSIFLIILLSVAAYLYVRGTNSAKRIGNSPSSYCHRLFTERK